MSSKFVGGALFAVLLAALGGCGGSGPGDAGPEATAAAPTTGTPAAEATGDEEPAPDGGGQPAIETVGLPVGGGGDKAGEANQCVFLNWLAAGNGGVAFPAGVQVMVTEVNIDGGVASEGCNGIPPCKGYTFTSAEGGCSVQVKLEPGDAKLSVSGQVTCPLPAAECEAFRDGLANATTGTTINGPAPSPTPTETPSETPPTTESPPPTVTDEPQPPVQSPDEPLPTG